MNEFIQIIMETIKNLNWSTIADISTTIVSIVVAITAFLALRTWKYKTRAQNQIQLMDELTDTVHEYIQAMDAPTQTLKFVKIGIEAYTETESLKGNDKKNAGVIQYIEKKGKAESARLSEYLGKVRPITNRMISLATKGQVLGFKNYKQCYDACVMLAWSYNQIDVFAFQIGSTNLYWENEKIQQTLDKVMTVNAETIKDNLEKQNTAFLEFVKQSYRTLLS
jgi:hypothetical protein